MKSHFETLPKAKKAYKERTGHEYKDRHKYGRSSLKIFNRNKGRKSRGLRRLKRPYFLGSEFEWLNL
jgi:hypothetical protein